MKKMEKKIGNKRTSFEGGNGLVTVKDGVATKVLKGGSKEKKARFRIEMEVLNELRKRSLPNIVEVLEVNIDGNVPNVKMKAYPGNSNDLLDMTRGNVRASANLLLPIARTLAELAASAEPIFHRDLKPDNFLYSMQGDDCQLIVADFGCAHFQTDDDSRLTEEFRAVGAMAYRAPEYQHGRVNAVNEKGDIFSLGKLLWFFINGTKWEVFPYTLWFPSEYNLAHRFPSTEGIDEANLLIASAVQHDAEKRLCYDRLIEGLENLSRPFETMKNAHLRAILLADEKQQEHLRDEKNMIVEGLLNLFVRDLKSALHSLQNELSLKSISEMLERAPADTATVAANILNGSGTHPVWDYHGSDLKVIACMYPANRLSTAEYPVQLETPYLLIYSERKAFPITNVIYAYTSEKSVFQIVDNQLCQYDQSILHDAFLRTFEYLARSIVPRKE